MLVPPAQPDQRQKDTVGRYRFVNSAILHALIKEMGESVMDAETSTSLANIGLVRVCLSRTGVAIPKTTKFSDIPISGEEATAV